MSSLPGVIFLQASAQQIFQRRWGNARRLDVPDERECDHAFGANDDLPVELGIAQTEICSVSPGWNGSLCANVLVARAHKARPPDQELTAETHAHDFPIHDGQLPRLKSRIANTSPPSRCQAPYCFRPLIGKIPKFRLSSITSSISLRLIRSRRSIRRRAVSHRMLIMRGMP